MVTCKFALTLACLGCSACIAREEQLNAGRTARSDKTQKSELLGIGGAAPKALEALALLFVALDGTAAFNFAGVGGVHCLGRSPCLSNWHRLPLSTVMQIDGAPQVGDSVDFDFDLSADGKVVPKLETMRVTDRANAANVSMTPDLTPRTIELTPEQASAARIQEGNMNFEDFMAYVEKAVDDSGQAQSEQEKKEAEGVKKKIASYPLYVSALTEEEKTEPSWLIDEVMVARKKGVGLGPETRVHRVAQAAGKTVAEVVQFVLEFSMLRESLARIAKGESVDDIRESIDTEDQSSGLTPKQNRAQRRAARKKGKKSTAGNAGFR